ncbi:hypothetical protein GCM10027075_41660 [Streptomyces heilongjiangensis]
MWGTAVPPAPPTGSALDRAAQGEATARPAGHAGESTGRGDREGPGEEEAEGDRRTGGAVGRTGTTLLPL